MYSPQVGPDQVKKLYRLKCAILATGQKTTMTAMVREALDKYLSAKEKELKEQLAERGEKVVDEYPDEHIYINRSVVYEEITTVMDNKADRG